MRKVRSTKQKLIGALQILLLCAWVSITVVIVAWIILTSFKANTEIFTNIWGLPTEWRFDNYKRAWVNGKMGDFVINTVILVGSSLLVTTTIGVMAAYACSRFEHLRWPRWVLLAFTLGMSVPGQVLIVPLYIMYADMHLIDTYTGLILIYTATSLPFTTFTLSGFFRSQTREIEEAARIDGCDRFQAFLYVFVPMARGGILTVVLLNLFSLWNEYYYSILLTTNAAKMPLSAGLYNLRNQQQYGQDWASIFAGVVILLIPTMVIFFLMQKYMVRGINDGAVKS